MKNIFSQKSHIYYEKKNNPNEFLSTTLKRKRPDADY